MFPACLACGVSRAADWAVHALGVRRPALPPLRSGGVSLPAVVPGGGLVLSSMDGGRFIIVRTVALIRLQFTMQLSCAGNL